MGRREEETKTHEVEVVEVGEGRDRTAESKLSVSEQLKLNHIAEGDRKAEF